MYTRGERAAVTELCWSRLLEGMLQEREQSQKSEETYFTLLILSIVLNEGHSRPKALLCIFSLCAVAPWRTTSSTYRKKGAMDVFLFMCVMKFKLKSRISESVTYLPFVVIVQFSGCLAVKSSSVCVA